MSIKWNFTTYEYDSESGNHYAQARYHISRLGRLASPDPIAGSTSDPQSLNRYSYSINDPANVTDPSGAMAGCYTAQANPKDKSQQASGNGPSESDTDESDSNASSPPQGCGSRVNPFDGGGLDGVFDDGADITDLLGVGTGILGSGRSIGGFVTTGPDLPIQGYPGPGSITIFGVKLVGTTIGWGPDPDYPESMGLWNYGIWAPAVIAFNWSVPNGQQTSMGPPTAKERLLNRLQCAADYADQQSLAMGASGGAPPNFLENLFLGNTFSGFVNIYLDVVGARTPTGSEVGIGLLSGGGQGLPGGGSGFKGATGVLQDAGISAIGGQASVAAAETMTVFGYAKLAYDMATLIYGFSGPCK